MARRNRKRRTVHPAASAEYAAAKARVRGVLVVRRPVGPGRSVPGQPFTDLETIGRVGVLVSELYSAFAEVEQLNPHAYSPAVPPAERAPWAGAGLAIEKAAIAAADLLNHVSNRRHRAQPLYAFPGGAR